MKHTARRSGWGASVCILALTLASCFGKGNDIPSFAADGDGPPDPRRAATPLVDAPGVQIAIPPRPDASAQDSSIANPGGGHPGDAGDAAGPADTGVADTGVIGPSCGPLGMDDCSTSILVPGGTFKRNYDGVPSTVGCKDPPTWDPSWVATVSDFRLDKYEVTVGRFRAFFAAYPGSLPAAGAGKNPNNPSDPGWDPAWNAHMPGKAEVALQLYGDTRSARYRTWTDLPGPNENKPINGLTWFIAFAFCTWDGGRLPTDAEFNYAASGGSEQRVYLS